MIQKFKDFDKDEFLAKKDAIKEAVEPEEEVTTTPEETAEADDEEYTIPGTPVYENPILVKIANIVGKKLKNAGGDYGIGYNVVYLNNVPGVRFYDKNGGKTIICCRSTHEKSISVFDTFEIGQRNTALRTYSTKKLGFKDMIDQLIDDLSAPGDVSEAVINEGRYGLGWSETDINGFKGLAHDERDYIYSFIRKFGKSTAGSQLVSLLDSGDKIAVKIWEKYRGKPGTAKCGGPVKYMMDMANAVISAATGSSSGLTPSIKEAYDKGLLDDLIADYKGGTPAIVTTGGEEYDTGEEVDEWEAKRIEQEKKLAAEIEADAENYRETVRELKELSEAMCNYVKSNGKLDKDDKSIMSRRGVLITGKGGIGKTFTLKEVLKDKKMTLNKDYVWAGSGNSTAESLYKLMYEYNGKMLVFDDSPNLFDGGYRISMWKNALQTEIEDCLISCPTKDSKTVYDVRRLKGDRQKRYFTEIGRKSEADKDEFRKREMKKRGLKFSSYKGSVISEEGLGKEEIDLLMQKIDDMWEDVKRNAQPAIPNEFIFRGVVVIISNYERERFIDEVGKGNWDAISSRFRNFDIAPKAMSLWIVMKEKIETERDDKSIPDDMCAIPRDMADEFIKEVETLLADPSGAYQSINWRTITMFHDVLSGEPGRRSWKRTLRDELARK